MTPSRLADIADPSLGPPLADPESCCTAAQHLQWSMVAMTPAAELDHGMLNLDSNQRSIEVQQGVLQLLAQVLAV